MPLPHTTKEARFFFSHRVRIHIHSLYCGYKFLTVDEIINNRQQDIIISQLFISKLKAFNNNNNNSKGSREEEKSLNFKKKLAVKNNSFPFPSFTVETYSLHPASQPTNPALLFSIFIHTIKTYDFDRFCDPRKNR